MGVLRYYGLVLRAAFTHSLSIAQDIIFGAILVVGLAAVVARRVGMRLDLTPWLTALGGWGIAAIVFGSIILVRLLLAPYWIWKEQRVRLDGLLSREADPQTLAIEAHTAELREQNEWRRREIDPMWVALRNRAEQVAATAAKGPGAIEICFKAGAPYEVSEIVESVVKSTVAIGIRNSGGRPISNCKVYIESISPPPRHGRKGPIILSDSGFLLNPSSPEKIVEIATHWDHFGPMYRFSEPHLGGFSGPQSLMDTEVKRTIVVKVVASECQKSAMFHVWLDESDRLRLRLVADVP